MTNLVQNVNDLAQRIAQEFNALRAEVTSLRALVDSYHPPTGNGVFDMAAFDANVFDV